MHFTLDFSELTTPDGYPVCRVNIRDDRGAILPDAPIQEIPVMPETTKDELVKIGVSALTDYQDELNRKASIAERVTEATAKKAALIAETTDKGASVAYSSSGEAIVSK